MKILSKNLLCIFALMSIAPMFASEDSTGAVGQKRRTVTIDETNSRKKMAISHTVEECFEDDEELVGINSNSKSQANIGLISSGAITLSTQSSHSSSNDASKISFEALAAAIATKDKAQRDLRDLIVMKQNGVNPQGVGRPKSADLVNL